MIADSLNMLRLTNLGLSVGLSVSFSLYFYIYIMGRVFATGSGNLGWIPVQVKPKTENIVFDDFSIIRYGSCVSGAIQGKE